MIIRLARARSAAGQRAALERFLREDLIPTLNAQPGLLRLVVGQPLETEGDRFTVMTVWKDLAALKAFAGERWEEPRIVPKEKELLRDLVLEHYLSVDGETEPMGADG